MSTGGREWMKQLSKREREIMDVVYSRGAATASEVLAALTAPPSYSAVRALLRTLVDKGHLRHTYDGPRYLYSPTVAKDEASSSALQRVLDVFFDGSTEMAVAALLKLERTDLDDERLQRLAALVEAARKASQSGQEGKVR